MTPPRICFVCAHEMLCSFLICSAQCWLLCKASKLWIVEGEACVLEFAGCRIAGRNSPMILCWSGPVPVRSGSFWANSLGSNLWRQQGFAKKSRVISLCWYRWCCCVQRRNDYGCTAKWKCMWTFESVKNISFAAFLCSNDASGSGITLAKVCAKWRLSVLYLYCARVSKEAWALRPHKECF